VIILTKSHSILLLLVRHRHDCHLSHGPVLHWTGGTFVVCGGLQGQPGRFKGRRAQQAAAAAGLVITRQLTVVTKEGKPPLFAVYVMKWAETVRQEHQWQQQRLLDTPSLISCSNGSSSSSSSSSDAWQQVMAAGQLPDCESLFVAQHLDGQHSQEWHAARAAMGLPPLREKRIVDLNH